MSKFFEKLDDKLASSVDPVSDGLVSAGNTVVELERGVSNAQYYIITFFLIIFSLLLIGLFLVNSLHVDGRVIKGSKKCSKDVVPVQITKKYLNSTSTEEEVTTECVDKKYDIEIEYDILGLFFWKSTKMLKGVDDSDIDERSEDEIYYKPGVSQINLGLLLIVVISLGLFYLFWVSIKFTNKAVQNSKAFAGASFANRIFNSN